MSEDTSNNTNEKKTKNSEEYDNSFVDKVAYGCKKYGFPILGTIAAGMFIYVFKDAVLNQWYSEV